MIMVEGDVGGEEAGMQRTCSVTVRGWGWDSNDDGNENVTKQKV